MQTQQLVAGTTLNFLTAGGDYPASDGWVLTYYLALRSGTGAFSLIAAAKPIRARPARRTSSADRGRDSASRRRLSSIRSVAIRSINRRIDSCTSRGVSNPG